MRNILLIALLAVVAWVGWKFLHHPGGPTGAYVDFADAVVHSHQPAAEKAGDENPDALKDARDATMKAMNIWSIEALHGTSYDIKSCDVSGDTARIDAVQTVRFDPPGVTSALGGAAVARLHDVVELTKSGAGWRIKSFAVDSLGVGESRGH